MPAATCSIKSRSDCKPLSMSSSLKQRVENIRRAELDFIDSDLFHTEEGQQECESVDYLLLDRLDSRPQASRADSARSTLGSVHLSRMCSVPLLSPAEEQALFRRMNYMKMRASALRQRMGKRKPQLEIVEHIEEHIEEALRIQDRLIQSNLRLVASLVKKFVNDSNVFDELFSEGVISLMKAVEKFDFALGYRFSTYATQAIRRHLYRSVVSRQQERSRFVAAEPVVMEEVEDDRTSVSFDEGRWSKRLAMLNDVLSQLDDRERYIVERRYGLTEDREVQTLQSLAGELGVCKERVRQLQQRALAKMTDFAEQLDPDRLGLPNDQQD